MNAGQAITRAMKLDRNTDLLALLHLCPILHAALTGYYWGWYGLDIAARHPRSDMHAWACPMRDDVTAACSCTLIAHRRPWMAAAAQRDLNHGWEPRNR